MPRGQPKIDVCLDIDLDGIIHASATELSTGKQKELRTVTNDKFRITQEILDRTVSEVTVHKDEDEARKRQIEEQLCLDSYSYPLFLHEFG
jgi:molecular chaperone DnaK (HSP70)